MSFDIHKKKITCYCSEDQNSLDELYDFEDETGLLDRHRQLFREESSEESCLSKELDIKIMFYELIKMLCDFQNRRNGRLRQIHKIDGFQELTNKLFLHKIKNLKLVNIYMVQNSIRAHDAFVVFLFLLLCFKCYLYFYSLRMEETDFNLPKIERSESTINFEQRLTVLEQSNQALGRKVINLESENKDLKTALKGIQVERSHKNLNFMNVENFNEEELAELLTRIEKDKSWLTQRVQELNDDQRSKKCASQMYSENIKNPLVFLEQLQKGSENDKKIENKEQKEIKMKVDQLEQADVYLQETTKQVMEKLASLESILRISTHSHDDTRSELLMLKDSLQSMNTKEKLIQNKSALHNSELFAKSDKHLNNQQTPLQQGKKFQMSLQEISTTNFSDTKSVVSISPQYSDFRSCVFRPPTKDPKKEMKLI